MDRYQDALPAQLMQGIARRGFETPEEAYFECERCGPIVPYHVKLSGRWLKGTCECMIRARQEREQAEMRLAWMREQPKRSFEWLGRQWSDMPLVEKTFDNFDIELQHSAYESVMFFLGDMHGSLILHSEGYGTGKTHLLAGIVNHLRMIGIESRFTTAPKLFRAIQERMDHKESYTQLILIACCTPLLVLDDVDKAKPSEWKHELFFEIVDERVKRGLPIALSTNRVSDLAFYVGGAACSRLSISQIDVDMSGSDYRMRL
jgi:DNA replication protein DnaC